VDKVIRTKEQADHSLPYLLAVAMLDGDVRAVQFGSKFEEVDVLPGVS
jgi:2-methylcitrate dehydratase